MQYDVNNGLLQVVIEGEEINAVIGEAAQINVGEAINYIQTGTAEIEQAVQEGITQFNGNATEKTNEFDLNAQNKTSDFNTNASEKTNDFNLNAQEKTSDYNTNASEKLSEYNENATEKLSEYNSNASEKLSEYNSNASQKTTDFNTNAENKTTLFNNNYTEKKAIIDAKAAEASLSAAEAKQWAIGDPSEPVGNSAKYWAEYAEQETAGVEARVTSIEGKIPSTATSSNKLTDKSYVDSQDNNLQTQIDAIVSSSDVFDIVGTYAELQAYDITTVPVNDIIKVLVDETHSGAATYYRCVENNNVKSWSYIGSEGAYYTKGETNTLLNAKQDTLISGTNIKTINNNSILGSGNLDINGLPTQTGQSGKFLTTDGTDASWADVDALPSQTGQSGKYLTTDGSSASWATLNVNPDNKSITTNSSDELQTVGVINQNDTTTAIKTWTGTKAQYDAIVTKDANTLYNITDDTDVTDIRTLGQIVQSTIPLVDAGLHLLDGSVIAYGSYKAFVDYMAGLVSDYPDLFTSEANWQTSVTNYGVCGKFVYNSLNKTVRLPKITGFTEGAIDPTVLGDLTTAGLPNIEGSVNSALNYYRDGMNLNATGAFGGTVPSSGSVDCSSTGSNGITKSTITFNASDSNPIYGNSTTVQPQSIKVLYYICIATYPKTQIEVDIDEIVTDLNGKADIDLSNMNPTQTVKNTIVGWGMPDYSQVTTISFPYTCLTDGFIIHSSQNSGEQNLYINGNLVWNKGSTQSTFGYGFCLPVSKDDVITASGLNSTGLIRFIPFKGVN